MKNHIRRMLAAIGGDSSSAPWSPPSAPLALPAPQKATQLRAIKRAEEIVLAAERAEAEAVRVEAEALEALEAPRKAAADATKALEAAEDAAAAAPGDLDVAERLLDAQRAAGLASGVLRSAQRRHTASSAATAKVRAEVTDAKTTLEAERADEARADAAQLLSSIAQDAATAQLAYAAGHPTVKLAAVFAAIREAHENSAKTLGSVVHQVQAALEMGEAADQRLLEAAPERAEEIRAAAEERRAKARAALEVAADVETWYSLASGPLAMFELIGEQVRAAEAELRQIATVAHEAGLEARKLGSSYEPIALKLADAAIVFGHFLSNDPATRENIDITKNMRRVLGDSAALTGYGRAGIMRHGDVGRLLLRDPHGRPTLLDEEVHRRLVECGDRTALEKEEQEGRGTDPRLAAMRAESARRTAECLANHEKRSMCS